MGKTRQKSGISLSCIFSLFANKFFTFMVPKHLMAHVTLELVILFDISRNQRVSEADTMSVRALAGFILFHPPLLME